MIYCNNRNCDVMSCMRNPKNIPDPNQTERVAHLEDNPLYCKKGNWYGYQVTPEQAGNSSHSELLEENKDDQD